MSDLLSIIKIWDENPPRLCTVHGKVMVSPSALVRLVEVEMMVAMGEVAGVEEAKVRRARERLIGPVHSFPIEDPRLQTSTHVLIILSVSGIESNS